VGAGEGLERRQAGRRLRGEAGGLGDGEAVVVFVQHGEHDDSFWQRKRIHRGGRGGRGGRREKRRKDRDLLSSSLCDLRALRGESSSSDHASRCTGAAGFSASSFLRCSTAFSSTRSTNGGFGLPSLSFSGAFFGALRTTSRSLR